MKLSRTNLHGFKRETWIYESQANPQICVKIYMLRTFHSSLGLVVMGIVGTEKADFAREQGEAEKSIEGQRRSSVEN